MRGHDEQTTPHVQLPVAGTARAGRPSLRAVRARRTKPCRQCRADSRACTPRQRRPSIPPEQLLRAFVATRCGSERLLMVSSTTTCCLRWFVGLNMDDPVWHPLRLPRIATGCCRAMSPAACGPGPRPGGRAGLGRTLGHRGWDAVEAWASLKSFRCVDAAESDPPEDPGNPTVFHGERRRNDTHQSTTDPEAMLYRKGGKEAGRISATCCWTIDGACRQRLRTRRGPPNATRPVLLLEASDLPGQHGRGGQGLRCGALRCDVRVQDVTPHVGRRSAGVRSTVGPRGMRAIT